MQDSLFDELDIAIVDAVRYAPRASWRELAPVLDVDPATVSRRWSRMQSAGVVWVTAHPQGSAMPSIAVVEITCAPGRSKEVAESLADDAQAATVKVTAGARDLMVTAQAPDLGALSGYLLDRVQHVPGITTVRSRLVTRPTVHSGRWREGALDPDQRRLLQSQGRNRPNRGGALKASDRRIVRALSFDGRMSFELLAEHVGLSSGAVRRRLARLESAGLIAFRCETSHHLSAETVYTCYFGSIEVGALEEAEARIRSLPGVRACNLVAGPCNVIVDARMRSMADAHDFERRMSEAVPALRIQDRSVVLRTVKMVGHILDAEGRSVRPVPFLAAEED